MALLLIAVFVVVMVSVRDQVRQSVSTNLESGQRVFATIEARRQRELSEQVAALAESPRLKAAVDTYAAESGTNTDPVSPRAVADDDSAGSSRKWRRESTRTPSC